jgi:DNA repair protein RecO (recombination protein O)
VYSGSKEQTVVFFTSGRRVKISDYFAFRNQDLELLSGMPESRTYQTEAIIIRKIKLGEADRIVTLFTPRLGKIRAVAKGVRRPKSRMSGHLELLTYSRIDLVHGRNLDTVIGCETINGFLPLKADLDLSTSGLYITELTDQFTVENAENFDLFRLLLDTLEKLQTEENREMLVRYFEMHLLNTTGYRPELMHCVVCKKPLQPVVNAFSMNSGGMLCDVCMTTRYGISVPVNTLKVLRLLQSDDYATVRRIKLTSDIAEELNAVLRHYIRYLLEQEVKSTGFMDSLKSAFDG